jgi:hypothetical protein
VTTSALRKGVVFGVFRQVLNHVTVTVTVFGGGADRYARVPEQVRIDHDLTPMWTS